ncbi:MAG: cupredoxin domain-containing protein [Candidatus Binataceae bacterium]
MSGLTAVLLGAIGALIMAGAGPAYAAKPAVTIKMTDTPPKFLPEKATIKVGQSVEWINSAATLHSVDADASMVQNPKDVILPAGAKPFDSGFMPPGATFDYTFTVPGAYHYTCVPHEKDGMKGEVDVAK